METKRLEDLLHLIKIYYRSYCWNINRKYPVSFTAIETGIDFRSGEINLVYVTGTMVNKKFYATQFDTT